VHTACTPPGRFPGWTRARRHGDPGGCGLHHGLLPRGASGCQWPSISGNMFTYKSVLVGFCVSFFSDFIFIFIGENHRFFDISNMDACAVDEWI
jgi:hypothetical protein